MVIFRRLLYNNYYQPTIAANKTTYLFSRQQRKEDNNTMNSTSIHHQQQFPPPPPPYSPNGTVITTAAAAMSAPTPSSAGNVVIDMQPKQQSTTASRPQQQQQLQQMVLETDKKLWKLFYYHGLMNTEINFPRGGTSKFSLRKIQQNSQLNGIEDFKERKKGIKRTLNQGESPQTKKNKVEADLNDVYQNVFRQPVTTELLAQSVKGLAFVKFIREFDIILECVDGIQLTLPNNRISRTLSDDMKNANALIPEIFHKGLAFAFKVVETVKNKGTKNSICIVTICPYEVNSHLLPTTLLAGIVLNGIILSIEEKGVIIDLGFITSSVKGFVQEEDLPSYLSLGNLHIGQVALFRVKEKATSNTRVIKLTGFIEMDMLDASNNLDIKQLMPGTIIQVEPEKIVFDGIFAGVKNGPKVYIRKIHLPPRLRFDPARITKSFRACVICLQPNTSMLVLSGHPDVIAISKIEKRLLPHEIKIGSRLNCIVYHVDKKQNIYFRLGDENDKQTITAKCLRFNIDNPEENISKFSIESEHECRVIGYSSMERQLIVSTRTSDLTRTIISIEDAEPGTKLKGIIKVIKQTGLILDLGNGLVGFVSTMHLFDRPIKNWQKRFQRGQKIVCRMLFNDLNTDLLILTAKPMMVKKSSSDKLIIKFDRHYESCTSVGVIIKQLESGSLLIAFYNRVAGILNHNKVAALPVEQIQIGTSIRVLVKSVDSANGQIILDLPNEMNVKTDLNKSLVLTSLTITDAQAKSKQNRTKLIRHAKPFRIYTAKVIGPWPYGGTSKSTTAELLFPGGSVGRLHVCELNNFDEYAEASCPMQQFLSRNQGKTVNVKVLCVSKNKAISNSGREMLMELRQTDRIVECTANNYKLQEARKKLTLLKYRSEFSSGDIVPVFIVANSANIKNLHCEINPDFNARIHFDDIKIAEIRKRIDEIAITNQQKPTELDCEDLFDKGELRFGKVIGVNKTKRGKIISMELVERESDKYLDSKQMKTIQTKLESEKKVLIIYEKDDVSEIKNESLELDEKSGEEDGIDEKQTNEDVVEIKPEMVELQGEEYLTIEEYEQNVISRPNSILLWIGYIQFYLLKAKLSTQNRYDLGKAVAERALKTILFKNDADLTSVWRAYLDLEVALGTDESLQQCFKRSCAATKSLDMHKYLVNLLKKQPNAEGREEEIRAVYESMISKFRYELGPWFAYACHLLQRGDTDDSRMLLKRALQCTENKKHLTILSKFTQLEEQFGDKERAKTMQELVKTYKENEKSIDIKSLEHAISGTQGL